MRLIAKIALALCVLYAGVMPLSAQRTYEPKFYIGAKGGATMSSVAFTPHVKQSLLPGMLMGVSARYTEEKIFGLIGELLVEQRGWKENYEGAPFAYSRQITYVSLPVLTHIYFGSEKFKGFVNLGASVSYMLGSSISSDFDYANALDQPGFPSHRSVEQMSMELKNKFDYGIIAGIGMEFVIKKKHSITLEGRYYFGLGNIYPSSKKDVFSGSRNSTISVALGYLFRVK
ncbi:MAG: PorT family protein [Muribaculaceae bacterium]|nr:PorT family protein [Muribaculaceae bacterium]